MAEKFNGLGPRIHDIDETFRIVPKKNPRVVEIGCGNGRDAEEICKRTSDYLGIDVTETFIEMARRKAPNGAFKVADVEDFVFPDKIDIVFAFASLIHVPKEILRSVLKNVHAALDHGGVLRISMKHADSYEEAIRTDEFGTRTYYFYPESDMRELLRDFTILKLETCELRGQKWIEILAQK